MPTTNFYVRNFVSIGKKLNINSSIGFRLHGIFSREFSRQLQILQIFFLECDTIDAIGITFTWEVECIPSKEV